MNSFEMIRKKQSIEIKFLENLVSEAVEDLRNTLKKLLSENIERLELDFKGIDMIDSMGIGLLVSTHNTLSSRNAEMIISNLSADLLELFSVMRLSEFFTLKN